MLAYGSKEGRSYQVMTLPLFQRGFLLVDQILLVQECLVVLAR